MNWRKWLDEFVLAGKGILLATKERKFWYGAIPSFIFFGMLMNLLSGGTSKFELMGTLGFPENLQIIGSSFIAIFGVNQPFLDWLPIFLIAILQAILIGLVVLLWPAVHRRGPVDLAQPRRQFLQAHRAVPVQVDEDEIKVLRPRERRPHVPGGVLRKVSAARIQLEGLIYNNMSFYRDGKVVVAIVTDEMLREAHATEDDCDDLAGLAGRAECGEVSITIRDYPGGHSKVSVRSGESFDSCALCARFGGGGHKMAAGCNLPVPPQEARELLLRAIDEVLA